MVINSTVYDVSSYTTHPGGDAFVPYCGTDATVAFDAKGGKGNAHSTNAVSLLQSFELGALNQTIPVPAFIPSNSTGSNGSTRNSGEEDFGFGEDD
jgi:cytochrome b involved in lipid metabolism